jgi:D-serine deaminase-like pyridoxal phosphate-dependent protein
VPHTGQLGIGDPVFFRHSKAGELAEHFAEYLLLRGEHVVDRVRTYRGEGLVF